ncbi:MAG: hypothetical protein ABS69_10960 [Nitrosomonadales bacterium SCN 54-20]|nr:MAG: hypothetical protein ABS69_10960 [Nitrosomonadales bacterium SCN 54-20]
MSETRIGISGWRYPPWRGVFYPPGLPQHSELEYAARILPTIEINGTFYSLQTPDNFQHWYDHTPPGFIFSVKGSRYITHIRHLNEIDIPLANFFASGIFNLREKLGPILWQFPPNFRYDHDRMSGFFDLLPRDTEQALHLAHRRDKRMTGRARLAIGAKRSLRYAIEIRNDSFLAETFVELLRAHNIALVIADTARKWPCREDVTADFLYLRLHGDQEIYASGYTDEALIRWAQRIHLWREGLQPDDAHLISLHQPPRIPRDIYCYFDNDIKVKAPFDAQSLISKL